MGDLLNVDVARIRILEKIQPLAQETVGLMQAMGRVLAQDVVSEIDVPAFANSSMDGFAVRAEDTLEAPARLRVVMDIPAGIFPDEVLQSGEAARIMTGAPLPTGADAVVPVEETDAAWDAAEGTPAPEWVSIRKAARTGANVRPVGEDIRNGQLLIGRGAHLRPYEIGVLVALGWSEVAVVRKPRVAILTSGDELIGLGEPLATGKIRDVNSYTLAGLVEQYGGEPILLPPARDTLDAVRDLFKAALAASPDMIVSSAGVSVGATDFIRTVLAEYGQVDFWRINLRPGKPLAFGNIQGVPFFGLPGNPVSAMVTFDVLVRPALLKLAARPEGIVSTQAILAHDVESDGRRSYLRVRLDFNEGQYFASTTGTQSSGALTSMMLADGLLILPEGVTQAKAGEIYSVRLLREMINPDKNKTS